MTASMKLSQANTVEPKPVTGPRQADIVKHRQDTSLMPRLRS